MHYYSLIYPYLIYCVSVWGCAAITNMLKLTSLQKRAMRIIAKVNYLDHTSVILKKYKIIKLIDLHLFYCCVFLFKLKQNLLPSACHDFVLVNDINISNCDFSSFAIRAKSLRVIGTGIRCHLISRTLIQYIALNTFYDPIL